MTKRIAESDGRKAVDVVTRNLKDFAEKHGRPISEAQARKQAVEIAERAERRTNKQ